MIYNYLPIWGQNLACYVEGRKIAKSRYGKLFWKKLHEYESRLKWSYDQKCDYRDEQLRKMVMHCYRTVPYYHNMFNERGINPESIRTIDDLNQLPVLTKEIVNKNPDQFLSCSIPRKRMLTGHTSGTTGAGFVFKTTQEAICDQWAVWWRYRRAIGIDFDDWCAQLGGRSVVPIKQAKPPFFRWNKPCHQMYFSTYHLSDRNFKYYIEEIEKNNIQWIHGYPSAINLLADYVVQNQKRINIKYVTTGAENLLESQKEKIRDAFGVEPFQHYGLSEGTANFSECRDHIMFVDEDFAAVEFLDSERGDKYVIGTSLTNYAMPLIRYNTNDICEVKETREGRFIISLDGRKEDYIVLSDGTKIGRLDHIFKDMVNVREAQFVQKNPGEAELRIVKGNAYTDKDEKKLKNEITLRLKGIDISLIYVSAIQRTKNGKFRFVIAE